MMHQHLPSSRRIQPILKLKFLRKYLHSIPIGCMVLLLALTIISLNPTVHEQTSALENETNSSDSSEKPDALDNSENTENSNATTSEISEKIEENKLDNNTSEKEISYDDLISPHDVTPANPTATITISKADGAYGADQNAATWVSGAGVAYRSHNVTVKAQDVMDYNLVISYANNIDRMSLVGGDAALLGAGDKTPTEMGYNSWGYAWTDTGAAEASLTYKTMPKISAGDTLESKMTYSEDFTKKLVFAAKFGSDATPGTYHTEVMLSLTASPQVVTTTIKDIFQMQQMTPEICASTNIGEVAYLQDNRGGGYDNSEKPGMKTYMVKKLSDGNCWMGQNLNLIDKEITPANSDITENYTVPNHSVSDWTYGTANHKNSLTYYDYANDSSQDTYKYGAYYSWCAATAGTCTYSNEAPNSICPKGWRLPTTYTKTTDAGYSYSYNQLIANNNYYRVGTNTSWENESKSNGYWLGGKSAGAAGAVFFPATGRVDNGHINYAGVHGSYWTSLPYSFANYKAYVWTVSVTSTSSNEMTTYSGCSIRCISPSTENL